MQTVMTKKKKLNCWEFKKCGREKGGARADELGVCPAYPNSGRRCARVAITFCKGISQDGFAAKLQECLQCAFYSSEHYDGDYLDEGDDTSTDVNS